MGGERGRERGEGGWSRVDMAECDGRESQEDGMTGRHGLCVGAVDFKGLGFMAHGLERDMPGDGRQSVSLPVSGAAVLSGAAFSSVFAQTCKRRRSPR